LNKLPSSIPTLTYNPLTPKIDNDDSSALPPALLPSSITEDLTLGLSNPSQPTKVIEGTKKASTEVFSGSDKAEYAELTPINHPYSSN